MNENRSVFTVVPLGAALSASLIVLFIVCAAVAWIFPTGRGLHAWLGLFTERPFTLIGFLEGLWWNVVAAWLTAAVFVPVYGLVGSRRS